jgi:AraC-like DNA-binding protein
MLGMRINKPRQIVSGFHADQPDPAVAELHFLGEQWAPEDYPITRHSHPVWEFYLQLHGWSEWKDASGLDFRCPPGAFLAFPPDWEHWLERTSTGKHHFLFAAIDLDSLFRAKGWPAWEEWATMRPLHVAEGGHVEAAFRQLIRETTRDRPYRTERLTVAMEALVLDASRLAAESRGAGGRSFLHGHPAVEAAREAMDQRPGEPWTLASLARVAGVSPSHLSSVFAVEAGCPPHAYLMRARVLRAKELLSDPSLPISSIAHDLGFHSSQHFARVFRQFSGCSASEWRARAPLGA